MVYITGATGGIGKALTQKTLQAGLSCCAIARNSDKLYLLNKAFPTLFTSSYEVSLFPQPAANDSEVVLVLNAFDISPIKMAVDFTSEEIQQNIEFNILKQIELLLKLLQLTKSIQLPLKIIGISSGAAYRPISGWSLYCSGKAYINMFLQVLCQENSIPLVLYDPGVVDTKMQEYIRSTDKHDFPLVDQFQRYNLNNKLNQPCAVAEDILQRYILKWDAKHLKESFSN